MRFINQFCSLTPLTASACLQREARASFPTQSFGMPIELQPATLVLPPPHQIPSWLWYGYKSPSALLYGEEYDRDDLKPREMAWHPSMRITYSVADYQRDAKGEEENALENDDNDPLPTPRCNTWAAASHRGGSYMTATAFMPGNLTQQMEEAERLPQ